MDEVRFGVKSVVLCNRRLPVNFRYALLATEIAQSDADAQFAACRRRDGRETLILIWGGVTYRPLRPDSPQSIC